MKEETSNSKSSKSNANGSGSGSSMPFSGLPLPTVSSSPIGRKKFGFIRSRSNDIRFPPAFEIDESGVPHRPPERISTGDSSTDSASLSQQNGSPGGTRPKKMWEKHYRSFLTRKKLHTSNGMESAEGTSLSSTTLLPRSTTPPGTTTAAAPGQSPTSRNRFFRFNNENGIDEDKQQSQQQEQDGSVRGGKLFHAVFRAEFSGSHINRRKAKSMNALCYDELDTSKRLGIQKSDYNKMRVNNSELDERTTIIAKETDIGIRHRSQSQPSLLPILTASSESNTLTSTPVEATTAQSTAPTKTTTSFLSQQLEQQRISTNPSTSVTASETPNATSAQPTVEIKKAFTEFHNSFPYAQDSTSAYLGDEPSGRYDSRNPVVSAMLRSDHATRSYRQMANLGDGSGFYDSGGMGGVGAALSNHTQQHLAMLAGGLSPSTNMISASQQQHHHRWIQQQHQHHLQMQNNLQMQAWGGYNNSNLPTNLPPDMYNHQQQPQSNVSPHYSTSNHEQLYEDGPSLDQMHYKYNFSQQYQRPTSLCTVDENVVTINKSFSVLKPFQGIDTWQSGHRYLIAPAALTACPLHILKIFSSSSSSVDSSPFGVRVLGQALIKYSNSTQWSQCVLVLRQNYLLDYDPDSTTVTASDNNYNDETTISFRGLPRGYAPLQYGEAWANEDFNDALQLSFYASPCAKADKRILMIRLLYQRENRNDWIHHLNYAARLTIKDLYQYDESDMIGSGRYASVYKAKRNIKKRPKNAEDQQPQHKATTNLIPDNSNGKNNSDNTAANKKEEEEFHVAIKVIDKNLFWQRVMKGRERADTLVREISVQATLTIKFGTVIPTFVQMYGFFETSDHVVMELELLEDGIDLFQYISNIDNNGSGPTNKLTTSHNSSHPRALGEREAANTLRDIMISIDYMARIGLAHRDIKPANIFMCSSNKAAKNGEVRVKVGDLGMSTMVDVDGLLRGRCGTPGYVAPEIFSAGLHGGYANKVDVFSAGVTLYVMLCGYEPFYGETDSELVEVNKEGIVEFEKADWKKVSSDAIDLIKKMTHLDPKKRLSAKDVLKHKWIKEHAAPTYYWNHTGNQSEKSDLSSSPFQSTTAVDHIIASDKAACIIS